jgi:hypothetical protein
LVEALQNLAPHEHAGSIDTASTLTRGIGADRFAAVLRVETGTLANALTLSGAARITHRGLALFTERWSGTPSRGDRILLPDGKGGVRAERITAIEDAGKLDASGQPVPSVGLLAGRRRSVPCSDRPMPVSRRLGPIAGVRAGEDLSSNDFDLAPEA